MSYVKVLAFVKGTVRGPSMARHAGVVVPRRHGSEAEAPRRASARKKGACKRRRATRQRLVLAPCVRYRTLADVKNVTRRAARARSAMAHGLSLPPRARRGAGAGRVAHGPSTRHQPRSRSLWSSGSRSLTRSRSALLSMVGKRGMLTTASCGRRDAHALARTLPGARASRGLGVRTQAMTVEMRLTGRPSTRSRPSSSVSRQLGFTRPRRRRWTRRPPRSVPPPRR